MRILAASRGRGSITSSPSLLQRIRELGERRDKEDDERTKKLEEEILQGRKERHALKEIIDILGTLVGYSHDLGLTFMHAS
jgi:hypothetical protein